MIWLASFPRSGNTFFRNVLFEVYGLSSGAYHQDPARTLDPNYADHPVVKTHLLPNQLPDGQRDWPAAYLLRDGRDCLVSIAHHRKDIIAPGSDFYLNLLQAIVAMNGSFFGGWSQNVNAWRDRGALIIAFTDLIAQPLQELERLRTIMDLPPAQEDKLPSFQQLKFGQPKYRATAKVEASNQKHFRRGKVGGWRDELPDELHQLFWIYHGQTMREMGFTDGEPQGLSSKTARHQIWERISARVLELKSQLPAEAQGPIVAVLGAVKLKLAKGESAANESPHFAYEDLLLRFKAALRQYLPQPMYRGLSTLYRQLPIREWLQRLKTLVIRKPL